MADFFEQNAQQVIQAFLGRLRGTVKRRSLRNTRLPPWLRATKVRAGWINDSLVAAFEDTTERDRYQILGSVHADTMVLLNIQDFVPSAACLKAQDAEGLIILSGQYQDWTRTIVNLTGEQPALFDCGYAGYHGPRALFNLFLQHSPAGSEVGPVATRFVPFALYVHRSDAIDPARVWRLCEQHLMDLLVQIHDSEQGDFYERLLGPATDFAMTKESSVVVLGKDSGTELDELIQVRDYLRGRGYNAQLIRYLPEISEMSNEEKVRLWTLSSRFCVMVDRIPAGQIAEYLMLRGQRSILAVLRPFQSASTHMIGDDTLVDINFIRIFEFEQTPLTVLDDVIAWAEEIARTRSKAYDKTYPWRREPRSR
ncbi:hypothetical protein M1N84_01800 [Dehalococcoidia bacterium]|nr:hypothetical protein [Dehalococcoidia bacterium]